MPATPFKHRPTRDGSADLRVVSPSPHLALVPASQAKEEVAEPTRAAARPGLDTTGRTPQELFCTRMRATRERRGLTLDTVASATKVSASHFAALERGDVSRWPKGLYRRSFFRSYATALGLPPDSTVEEFIALFPDDEALAAEAAAASGPAEAPLRLTMGTTPRRDALQHALSLGLILDGLAVVLLALLLVWWLGASFWTAGVVVALCYYPTLARTVRRRLRRRVP